MRALAANQEVGLKLIFWTRQKENPMRLTGTLTIALGVLSAAAALGQIPSPAGLRTGPGVQAPADEKEPEVLKACKTPPPARGGGRGRGPGRANATAEAGPRDYTVKEIPGVIAAGQQ